MTPSLQAFIQERKSAFRLEFGVHLDEYQLRYMEDWFVITLKHLAHLTLEAVRVEEKNYNNSEYPDGYNLCVQDQATKAREFLGEEKS